MVKIELIHDQHIIKEPENKFWMRFFGMINTYPKNATFVTQNEEEKVVIIMRKHFINNISWMLNTGLLLLAPTIIGWAFTLIDTNLFQNALINSPLIQGFSPELGSAFLFFYYTICASYALLNFVHWYYDLFIISNERFISVDFDIIKGQTTTDIPLQDIIDISEKVHGFWSTFFGFGLIEFKTLSEKFIVMEGISQSTWFRDSFADLIKFIRDNDNEKSAKEEIAMSDGSNSPDAPVVEKPKMPTLANQPMRSLEP